MRGVDLLDRLVVEPEALDRAGRHVLGRDVGLLQHLLDDLEPPRRLQVDRQRLLVDVELVEIPGVVIGLAGPQPAAGIAAPRVLDLDHLGAEPGQHLGAGRARLELGEIDDLDALQKIEVLGCRSSLFPPVCRPGDSCAISLAPSQSPPQPRRRLSTARGRLPCTPKVACRNRIMGVTENIRWEFAGRLIIR